jgi:hypothetical protein
MRNIRKTVIIIWALSALSVLATLVILLLPLGIQSSELANRAQVSATVSSTQETIRRQFLYLKSKGIEDPNIDLFLAVMQKESQDSLKQAQAALDAGADPSVTDGQILAKYRNQLKDFTL